MRPFPGDDAPHPGQRSRVVSDSDTLTGFGLPPGPQMTYFFADESTVGSTPSPIHSGTHHHHHRPHSALHPPPPSSHRPKDNNNSTRTSGSGGGSKVPSGAESFELANHKVRGNGNSQPNLDNHHNKEEENNSCSATRTQDDTKPTTPATMATEHKQDGSRTQPTQQNQCLQPPPLTPPFRPVSDHSDPNTPLFLGKPGPPSSCALSSISSRRNSLAGSMSEDLHFLDSQVASSLDGDHGDRDAGGDDGQRREDEYREDSGGGSMPTSMMMGSGSVPQLIMPSIKMPSRRPFTEEGKAMGRLKVMIAGDTGVGKTSLVKAIVQSCEHIVHVDPIGTPMTSSGSLTRSGNRNTSGERSGRLMSRSSSEVVGTSQITEIYASTKPYPEWWSEIDDFSVLKRRKSLGDSVLDRNICFVDTPGYRSFSSVGFARCHML